MKETEKQFIPEQEPIEIEEGKKVFLEIGAGRGAVPFQGDRKFGKEEVYIGIDPDEEALDVAEKGSKHRGHSEENVRFRKADAEKLPIENEKVDEVFFGNVFGDSSVKQKELAAFLEEAKRVLKKAGRIIIKETNTPLNVIDAMELLEKHGFLAEKVVHTGDKDWEKELKPFEHTKHSLPCSPYSYLIFAKVKESKIDNL